MKGARDPGCCLLLRSIVTAREGISIVSLEELHGGHVTTRAGVSVALFQ